MIINDSRIPLLVRRKNVGLVWRQRRGLCLWEREMRFHAERARRARDSTLCREARAALRAAWAREKEGVFLPSLRENARQRVAGEDCGFANFRGGCREMSVVSPGRERGYMFLGGNCGNGGKSAALQPADEGRKKRQDLVVFSESRQKICILIVKLLSLCQSIIV